MYFSNYHLIKTLIIIIVFFKIKKSQHNELKNIRRNLEKCFPNIGGFLLPHPGKAIVTNQAYNGLVKGDIRWVVRFIKYEHSLKNKKLERKIIKWKKHKCRRVDKLHMFKLFL